MFGGVVNAFFGTNNCQGANIKLLWQMQLFCCTFFFFFFNGNQALDWSTNRSIVASEMSFSGSENMLFLYYYFVTV